jgi:ATP-dependent Clp protease ATP-binding subunit ClpC
VSAALAHRTAWHKMSDTTFNFTPRARRVLALAQVEARRFSHKRVGADHLLLGLIKLGDNVAADVLRRMGIDVEILRVEVERQIGSGGRQKVSGHIPFGLHTRQVLSRAEAERKKLDHMFLGPEHLLLGVLLAGDTVAFRALTGLGVKIEKTRSEVVKMLKPAHDKMRATLDGITAQYLDELTGRL